MTTLITAAKETKNALTKLCLVREGAKYRILKTPLNVGLLSSTQLNSCVFKISFLFPISFHFQGLSKHVVLFQGLFNGITLCWLTCLYFMTVTLMIQSTKLPYPLRIRAFTRGASYLGLAPTISNTSASCKKKKPVHSFISMLIIHKMILFDK